MLCCSHNTEGQICQDSSVSVTGTRLDNQVLTSGFLEVFIALRCTTLPFRNFLWGSADNSFARPGRKQATASKLGIYSTYSPQSSIHFLARCSNFCKPLTKIQNVVRPKSTRQQWPPRRKKNDDLSILFSVQGTGGSPTEPDPEKRVGDQDTPKPR